MTPWLQDPDVTLYHGDCLDVLRQLPDRSVHMCATSPPFYGLRDYGTDRQIGLEETPDQWVDRLVQVFREVRRVLRDDGTLWVEIGDSYGSGGGGGSPFENGRTDGRKGYESDNPGGRISGRAVVGHKPKDLLGQPWLLAFALRGDGWYLRSEIIWARPNPMPESVTDRPTKSHSTVFLLSKRPRYFYDADAIREPHQPATRGHDPHGARGDHYKLANDGHTNGEGSHPTAHDGHLGFHPSGANARSVWQIPTEPTPYAHFATWPQQLVRRMILAGTSEHGCCPECGAPWVRDVERELVRHQRVLNPNPAGLNANNMGQNRAEDGHIPGHYDTRTVGWSPSCHHDTQPVPCTVLDPFAGSGTTNLVARNHGRHSIGIELNQQYLDIAAKRLQQLSLLTT